MRRRAVPPIVMAAVLMAVATSPYAHPLACELTGANGMHRDEMAHAACWTAGRDAMACHGAMACCAAQVAPTSEGPRPRPEHRCVVAAPPESAAYPPAVARPPHPPPPKT